MKEPLKAAKERALRLLSIRNRSEFELRRRLQPYFENEVIEEVLVWLRHLKYVDDEEFAQQWVESRRRHKPSGPRKLAYELQQKGIAGDIVERVLAQFDDDTEMRLACRALSKKVIHLENMDEATRRKLYGFLARRGFRPGVARRALDWVTHRD